MEAGTQWQGLDGLGPLCCLFVFRDNVGLLTRGPRRGETT